MNISILKLNRSGSGMLALCLSVLLMSLAACSGSDSNDTPLSTNSSTTTVTGSVFAAPVGGASVIVKDANGSVIAGPVNTAADGTYSVAVPTDALAADFTIEASGGTYADEATGMTTTGRGLAAYVAGGSMSGDPAVHLDPASTIVHDLAALRAKTFEDAKQLFTAAFGFTPDTSVAPKNAASTEAAEPEQLAGFHAALFSELTHDLGLGPDRQSELLTALAEDISDDGLLDGSTGAAGGMLIPEDIQNRFEKSLMSFLSNTTRNMTGLKADNIGNLPFAKVALTPTYRIEMIPLGMMGQKVGKSQFTLKVARRSDNAAVPGLPITLMPMMHMAMMEHTTPVDGVADNGDGTYTCTVYYVMGTGHGMGVFDVKAMIGGMTGETAEFYPTVGMAMGDTAYAKLEIQENNDYTRPYWLFNDGLESGMTSTFNIFIATKEDMMHYPAVSGDTVLSDPTGTVDPAATHLYASLASDFTTSIAGMDKGGGHWSIPGIGGLASGSAIYVRFIVNGKSTVQSQGTFTVTTSSGMSGM